MLPFIDYAVAGRNLKKILEERGLSQSELATMTGLKQPNIARFIATGKGVGPGFLRKIADALAIDLKTLYGLNESRKTA